MNDIDWITDDIDFVGVDAVRKHIAKIAALLHNTGKKKEADAICASFVAAAAIHHAAQKGA